MTATAMPTPYGVTGRAQSDEPSAARQYLEVVFGRLPGCIDLRLIEPDGLCQRIPCASIDDTLKRVNAAATRGVNLYVGIATRRTMSRAEGAGGKENLAASRALWVDCDFKAEGDRERFEELLRTFPMPASMIVFSGGGMHTYWLLEEPFDLTTEADVLRFEYALKGLCDYFDADRAATDASRILRVPGTINYPDRVKRERGRVPTPCETLSAARHLYTFSDFEEFELRGQALGVNGVRVTYDAKPFDGTLSKRVELMLRDAKIRGRFERSIDGLDDTSPSSIDFSLASLLAHRGLSGAEIEAAVRCSRAKDTTAQIKRDDYFTRTVEKALAEACVLADDDAPYQTTNADEHIAETQEIHDNYDTDTTIRETPAKPDTAALEDATDDGLAERLVRMHGEDLLRVPIWKSWFAWDGRRYRADHNEAGSRAKMRKTVRSIFVEAAEASDAKEAERLVKMALKGRAMSSMKAALWIAESDERVIVQPDELDADIWAFNVRNGTLDLCTGKLRPHRKQDRFTRCGPVAYYPDAKAPLWTAFLERVQRDPAMRRYLPQAAGYSMTGSTVAECMWILFGGGANGKSTFLETVRAAFGPDFAAELDAHTLTVRKTGTEEMELTLAPLDGRRLVTANELGEGQRLRERAVKKLTSGEPVRGRKRYSDSYEFVPMAKLWMATNHRPSVTGDDDAVWRRLRLIPFEVQIPEADRDLDLREKLRAELPGVLTWCVEGCLDWQRNGFAVPDVVSDATRDYRDAEDVIGAFLDEYCETGRALWISSADLNAALARWAKANGEATPTPKALGDRLVRRGFVAAKTGDKRGWKGLQLREEHRDAGRIASRHDWADN